MKATVYPLVESLLFWNIKRNWRFDRLRFWIIVSINHLPFSSWNYFVYHFELFETLLSVNEKEWKKDLYMRSCRPPHIISFVCSFIDLFFANSEADEFRYNFVIWKFMNSALLKVKVFFFFFHLVFPPLSYVRIVILTVACLICLEWWKKKKKNVPDRMFCFAFVSSFIQF